MVDGVWYTTYSVCSYLHNQRVSLLNNNKELSNWRIQHSHSSKLVSFADDPRVYSCIDDIEKCDQLQIDLNSVYDWAHVNNMFNANKFNCGSNVYTNPNMEIISPSTNVLDLGIYMSGGCTFNYHISSLRVLICQGGFWEHFILEIVSQC